MDEKEIIKVDEFTRCSINTIRNSGDDFFISHVDKENSSEMKIENRNEKDIRYPSLNRINASLFEENENYFNDEKEKRGSNKRKKKSSNKSRKELPTKSELSIKDSSDLISENNMPLKIVDKSIMEEITSDRKNYERNNTGFKIENYNEESVDISAPYYKVVEKCEVKDYIGFHKLYEILYFTQLEDLKNSENENLENKIIKCYRRYDNFDKFNTKLRRKYPFLIIPKLTPKNPLAKIISPEEDFYDIRERQLNFYLNFLFKNEFISKTKEFIKFTNDAEFDEDFFGISNEECEYYFPESAKITETLAKKIFGVFSGIFGVKDERKLSDEEITLRRMETHYKGILEKYREIKININNYLRTLKINSEGYKQLSSTCFYMKDTLNNVPDSKDKFKLFHEICDDVAEINKKHYELTGIKLENKFESFISILSGLCDAFDRYNEYNKLYENVLKANKEAKNNKLDNINILNEELKSCENFKFKFDQNLVKEVRTFIEMYNNTFSDLIEEFKLLLKSINSQVKIVSHNITNLGVK